MEAMVNHRTVLPGCQAQHLAASNREAEKTEIKPRRGKGGGKYLREEEAVETAAPVEEDVVGESSRGSWRGEAGLCLAIC